MFGTPAKSCIELANLVNGAVFFKNKHQDTESSFYIEVARGPWESPEL